MNHSIILLYLLLASLALLSGPAAATTYQLDSPQQDLVGAVLYTRSRYQDTLMDIARAQGMGFREMRMANPALDIWIPGEGTRITLPSQFILPDAPREGIVLNRPEKRLYYYHSDPSSGQPLVTTYPVGIGRIDRETPTGQGRVIIKLEDPAWYPTEQAIIDHAVRGKHLPPVVPPGPDNPLGRHALVLDIPGYLIHGTNRPDGIGMRVSQGCVRLYPEDIEALMAKVPIGTLVTLIEQAHKVGIDREQVWVEIHPTFDSDGWRTDTEQALVQRLIELPNAQVEGINWKAVSEAYHRADGIPTVVSLR